MLFIYHSEFGSLRAFKEAPAAVPVCCDRPMTLLTPNTVDAAKEKHVPAVKADGNIIGVNIGEIDHPMTEAHYIAAIILETDKGVRIAALQPGDKPHADFVLAPGEKALGAYEFCTLHGLWYAKI